MALPCFATSAASGCARSAVQRSDGGEPHVRASAAQPTHFPFGARYPGPPRSPQAANAPPDVAAIAMTAPRTATAPVFIGPTRIGVYAQQIELFQVATRRRSATRSSEAVRFSRLFIGTCMAHVPVALNSGSLHKGDYIGTSPGHRIRGPGDVSRITRWYELDCRSETLRRVKSPTKGRYVELRLDRRHRNSPRICGE
jgi:hypothetical protein